MLKIKEKQGFSESPRAHKKDVHGYFYFFLKYGTPVFLLIFTS